jgi:AraC-like DNA-binding protein
LNSELAAAMLRYTDERQDDGSGATSIEGMGILRSDAPKPPSHMVFRPALCIVVQGAKSATIGNSHLIYRAGEALVVGVDTPTIGKVVQASADAPCLVLVLELDLTIMSEVATELRHSTGPAGGQGPSVFVIDFQGPLADCALRLVRLLDTPNAVGTLFPGIMREICFWLLSGPHGEHIARLVMKSSPSRPLINAVHDLRQRFKDTVRVEELAEIARLSASAFHRQFRKLTSFSPLQYQKQLRLLEARRMLISGEVNAEAAAFAVGYESASQFSREYQRQFGAPPKRDLQRMVADHATLPNSAGNAI